MTNELDDKTVAGMTLSTGRSQWVFIGCVAFFIMSLVVSAITASKIAELAVFGLAIAIPIGTSLFAITFASTDTISEVWGASVARKVVVIGLFVRIVMVVFLAYAVAIPGAVYWDGQTAYSEVLSSSSRILLAGIITYPISQLADIYIFHWMKAREGQRNRLWLRNNVSTFCSQFIDSTFFILIAFWGIFETSVLVSMIFGQVVVKWTIALFDTPFVYLLRNLATGRKLTDFAG